MEEGKSGECVTLSAINYTYICNWMAVYFIFTVWTYCNATGLTAVTLTCWHTHYPSQIHQRSQWQYICTKKSIDGGEETPSSWLATFIYEHPYIPIIGHTHVYNGQASCLYWQWLKRLHNSFSQIINCILVLTSLRSGCKAFCVCPIACTMYPIHIIWVVLLYTKYPMIVICILNMA